MQDACHLVPLDLGQSLSYCLGLLLREETNPNPNPRLEFLQISHTQKVSGGTI